MMRSAQTNATRVWIDGKRVNCVGVRVEMYQSFVPMNSIGYYYPDRNWSWYDKEGQEYSWKITGKDKLGFDTGEVVPEIKWVVDFDRDEEYPEEGHWETLLGERINPGMEYTGPISWQEPGLRETKIEIDGSAEDLEPLAALRERFEIKVEMQDVVFTFTEAVADELCYAGGVWTLVCFAGEPKQELVGKVGKGV